jgi:MATE family multidrug resistance protein
MLSYSAMTVADTAFVSALGPAALAGVGLAGTLAFAAVVFGIGLLRGVKVVVSQAIGAGQDDRIDALAATGLLIAVGMGFLVLSAGQLLVWVVPPLAASPLAGEYAADYLHVRLLAAPVLFIFCTTREVSYGVGDSRTPMVASLLANIVNIGLDYVFIIELEYGPSGAAWATFVATFLEAGVVIWLRQAPGFRSLRKGLAGLQAVMRVGLATGLQFAVEVGAFTLLTILVAAMSETEMAAHQVALCIIHFAFLPVVAIGEAASVMAGQAVGANRDGLVRSVSLYCLAVGAAYALFCTLILAFLSPAIAGLFGDDLDVREAATQLLYLAAVFQLGDAFNITARCVLRGAGDVRFPALVGVGISWLALPPLTWFFGYQLEMGAFGAWLAITSEIFTVAAILWWRLWRGGWRASASRSRSLLLAQA